MVGLYIGGRDLYICVRKEIADMFRLYFLCYNKLSILPYSDFILIKDNIMSYKMDSENNIIPVNWEEYYPKK